MRRALLVLLLAGAAQADPPPPGPAPAKPAIDVSYRTSEQVAARLKELATGKADRELLSYGQSAGGRPLLALRIGADGLPVVLVHGGLGARDAAATVACLHLAERIAAGEDAEAANVAWLLLPAPNPDALDAFLKKAPLPRAEGVDRDFDGRSGEDGPDDADKDGEVLTMRRVSTRGSWAVEDSPDKDGKKTSDPRMLLDKGVDARRATSYEVLDEGLDDDGDGDVNEDPPGLDLTRQMAGWTEEQGPFRGDGRFPGQAPEAKALMDLSFETPALLAWYGFTGTGDRVLRASENGKVADDDDALYGKIAEALKAKVGLETKKASDGVKTPNPGSDLDWAAAHLWVPAFRVPVWRIAKEEGSARDRADADELDWLLWNDRVLGGKGFAPWKPFAHPTLGAVEIGGWRPYSRREPPADLLPAAVEAVFRAPLVHAKFRPVLEPDLEVKSLGAGTFRIAVRARNRGDAPTDTSSSEKRKRSMGVRAKLERAAGVEALGGPAVVDLGVVAPGGVSGEAVWLVRAPKGGRLGTVSLLQRSCGCATKPVDAP